MAAVQPPMPTYQPHLSPDVIDKALLSEAGLETVVYAGQAHSSFLPAAEGDAIQAGMRFLGPDGELHTLRATGRDNQLFMLDGGTTWENFGSAEQVRDYLKAKKFKHEDGKEINFGEKGARRGFMLGDGTGAGKGRQIAGVMVDNWNQGRRRHVWVTQKQPLLEDARRDWRALGHDPAEVFHFDELRKGKAPPEGVLFITYDTLKGRPKDPTAKSNLETLQEWLGPDFDGVIAFDEAHGMANAMDQEGEGLRGMKKGSLKAKAGLALQQQSPGARVLYVSATGATEVGNLAYAERLGLWGRGTAFGSREEFISEMEKGGTAAMEAVAQNLKAMGGYMARSLSLDDGTPEGTVTYDRLTHQLTDEQRGMYDALAEGWQRVLQHIDQALEITGGGKDRFAKAAARSQFWGAQQRFFNQVMTSMQTPAVIRDMEDQLAGIERLPDGSTRKAPPKSPVIQLVNTMEAATKRAVARREEGESLEDVDVSPREILMNYLEKCFPVHRFEDYIDENGNEATRLVTDSNGDPVVDPEAARIRDQLLDMVGAYKIPESPLDMIVNHFGTEQVAECTGRTQRLVNQTQDDGSVKRVLESRQASTANIAETKAFQDGRKKILIFSDAGGTGRSYHASRKAKNQDQRVHYLLQPGWRADNAVQGLGRTHRTNQAHAPHYRLVEIEELRAQKRFISTIARRLDQLGALTKGQRQTGSTGIFKAADNLESPEARRALQQFFSDVETGRVEGISFNDLMTQMGFKSANEEEERRRRRNGPPPTPGMEQFLNRLLSLRVDMQGKVFAAFEERLNQVVEQAMREGTLDVGVENFPADRVQKVREQTVYKDEGTGAEARHVVMKVHRKADREPFATTQQGKRPLMYVRNKQSGKVWAVYSWVDRTDARTGSVVSQFSLRGPSSQQYKDAYAVNPEGYQSPWERLDEPTARKLWDEQYAEAPEFKEAEEHFVVGAFLPVWNRIPGDKPKIYRLKTDDGQKVVGRHIPAKLVEQAMRQLGVHHEGEAKGAAEVHGRLSKGSVQATLANGWKLKPVMVGGERRIELTGPSGYHLQELQEDGVIKERIRFDTRFFVPVGEEGVKVLERITKTRPITDEVSLD